MRRPRRLVYGDRPVLTAKVGENSDLFADVARLHFQPGDRVLDATWFQGRFWRRVIPLPAGLVRSDLYPQSGAVVAADARALPFAAESFDVVVFDPPYKFGSARDLKDGQDGYRNNDRSERGVKEVWALYSDASGEAWRVLGPGGLWVVKGQDGVESGETNLFLQSPAMTEDRWEILDVFVLVRGSVPVMRHPYQFHARKNHSYLVVLRKPLGAGVPAERLF